MASYMDYTSPSTQYTFDVNKSPLFIKDNQNYINVLGIKQLNTVEYTGKCVSARHLPKYK